MSPLETPDCGKHHIIAAPTLSPFECACGRRIDPFRPIDGREAREVSGDE